ncbi:MAG: DUF5106 domain-containing protein [Bacteroidetes bacterium]|nr:DUF5106 domain-containing protein [Bacteroidota bacterium]MCL2303668.1 DUF5106 domain-containing protein [Lentimicrobiaceae bacterium]
MNRILTLFFCTIIFIANAQSGYQIRIKTENIHADTLFVKAYDAKSKRFTTFQALKFENDITIKDKTPLAAGIYILLADSTMLSEFLISDAKNQKFTFLFLKDDLKVEGSKENSANLAYTKQMMEFRRQEFVLQTEVRQAQQKGLPDYMLQVLADSLFKQYDNIYAERRAFQEKMINENKGLLLASIIQGSKDAPQPPKDYYQNRVKLFSFLAEHNFDDFPWEDERMFNTPILDNKFKAFAQHIFPLDAKASTPIVLKVFNESKKNRNMYYAFFDFLEREFGSIKSPYREEELYIAMLKDILNLPDLEETRRLRYEYELNLIDKNHAGAQAIDFNILLDNGDTISLYDINAEFLMLYFQHPDCPTCVELRNKMKDMGILNNTIASGRLKVVTIYFEDSEDLWRNYLRTRAFKNWTHGWNYDQEIAEKRLYDVRHIPMIMFLDKNKRIIKKDLLSNEIEDWLKRYL